MRRPESAERSRSLVCDGNLDIQEAGNSKDIYVYLIGAFCRKDQHRESQGTHSEDGEQSNIKILYRRTEGCPSEPVQTQNQFRLVL